MTDGDDGSSDGKLFGSKHGLPSPFLDFLEAGSRAEELFERVDRSVLGQRP